MPWRGPEYEGEVPTLGYELLALFENDLRVPAGDLYGRPFVPTDEQARFVLRWYAFDPESLRWLFRRSIYRRMKGAGKSPHAAAITYGEFVGPVLVDGFDAHGEPVGRPWPAPWIQMAALSEDQTDNTYVPFYEMLRDSPALHERGIDLGLTRCYLTDRPGRVEPVTSAADSREGQPITFAVLDQTEAWTRTNGGIKLAGTLRRNAAKVGGRTMETPNAWVPGERSVAEASDKAVLEGAAGILYDSLEPPFVDDLGDEAAVREAIRVARGDSHWIDPERVLEEIHDPDTDPGDAYRYFLNTPMKASGRAVDPLRWRELADPDRTVELGEEIGVGFDGSISDDSTVLIGCTRDGFVFEIASWERPAGAPADWRIPRGEVHEAVRDAFARWSVGRMFCDPHKWWSEIETWAELYQDGPTPAEQRILVLDTIQARRFAPACGRFVADVREGTLSHDGGDLLDRHLAATGRKKVRVKDPDDDGRSLFVFVKAGAGKIDASVAAVLAREAAATMPTAPEPKRPGIYSGADRSEVARIRDEIREERARARATLQRV